MPALRAALEAAGADPSAGLRAGLQSLPPTIAELVRISSLPSPTWPPSHPDRFHEFEENDGQGIAHGHGDRWYLSTERRVRAVTITGADPARPQSVVHGHSVTLDQLIGRARIRLEPSPGNSAPFQWECDHIGDLAWGRDILFAPLRNVFSQEAHFIFGLDANLDLVAWARLDLSSVDSLCAFHPWNELLYAMGGGTASGTLQAYDASAFWQQLRSPQEWGLNVPLPRRSEADIELRTATGAPDGQGAQGVVVSRNGRIYAARSHGDGDGPWDNRLYVYNGLTGRLIARSPEYDFPSPFGKDEIEGLELHPDGPLYVTVANNQWEAIETDDFQIYAFTFSGLPANAV